MNDLAATTPIKIIVAIIQWSSKNPSATKYFNSATTGPFDKTKIKVGMITGAISSTVAKRSNRAT